MRVNLPRGPFELMPWRAGRSADGPADFALLVPVLPVEVYQFLRDRAVSRSSSSILQWKVRSGDVVYEGDVIAEFQVPAVKSTYPDDKKAMLRAQITAVREGVITIGPSEYATWPATPEDILDDPRFVLFAIQPTSGMAKYINVFSLYDAGFERVVKYLFSVGKLPGELHWRLEVFANAANGQVKVSG